MIYTAARCESCRTTPKVLGRFEWPLHLNDDHVQQRKIPIVEVLESLFCNVEYMDINTLSTSSRRSQIDKKLTSCLDCLQHHDCVVSSQDCCFVIFLNRVRHLWRYNNKSLLQDPITKQLSDQSTRSPVRASLPVHQVSSLRRLVR